MTIKKYSDVREVFNEKQIFFASDAHFYHTNIIKYCDRIDSNTGKQIASVDRMHEIIIDNWNKKVPDNAYVIIAGDVAMGGKSKAESVREILDSLNGKFILVKGNHDTYVLDNPVVSRFEKVYDYLECKVTRSGQKAVNFIISHYPLLTWNGAGKSRVFHLHGHSHSSINHLNKGTTRLDIGMDNNNLTPFSFNDIMKRFEGVKYIPVDHHNDETNYK